MPLFNPPNHAGKNTKGRNAETCGGDLEHKTGYHRGRYPATLAIRSASVVSKTMHHMRNHNPVNQSPFRMRAIQEARRTDMTDTEKIAALRKQVQDYRELVRFLDRHLDWSPEVQGKIKGKPQLLADLLEETRP